MSAESRQPTVTIGFYPRERFALSGKALRHLFESTRMPFTLVIVDCLTPEPYRKEMETAVAGHAKVRWIRVDRFLLAGQCKNLVIKETTDDYVCFLENDNLVQTGWLERMVETAETFPAGAVIPLLYEGPTWLRHVHHDRGFADIRLQTDGRIEVSEDPNGLAGRWKWQEPQRITTAEAHCILYRRSTLEAIGPFDESMSVNTGTDTSFRLLQKGITLVLEPRAAVNHYPPTWIRRDERPFYLWRWDPQTAQQGDAAFRARWSANQFPDAPDFAYGQKYRTNPFTWWSYRAWRLWNRLVKS